MLVSEAFLPGQEPLSVVVGDTFDLAEWWYQASGNILGAGGGSVLHLETDAQDNPTFNNEVTSIEAQSCTGAQATLGVPSQVCATIPGSTFNGQTCFNTKCYGTAETNDFESYQQNPTLTSYYQGTHWWVTSASCSIEYLSYFGLPSCPNYGAEILGSGVMDFALSPLNPNSGSEVVGGLAQTTATTTSLNGVRGIINFAVFGLPPSATFSPNNCSFGSTLQPGTNCAETITFLITLSDSPGTYVLTFFATSPGATTLSTQYTLNLFLNPPSPVVVQPILGGTYSANQVILLVGYALSTDPGTSVGTFLPCSQLQFKWTAPHGSTGSAPTPTADPVNPGYCDSSVAFSGTGKASVTLSATDTQGMGVSAPVSITVSSNAPFTFTISLPSPRRLRTPPILFRLRYR